jgi:predicted amidohydrolase
VIRDLLVPARAAENLVYVIAADRVGDEGGITFMGGSRIVKPGGVVLAEAKGYEQDIIYAGINLADTQEKMGLLSQRRPDLYGLITQEGTGGSSTSV